jgi:hypothetical protein
MWKRLWKIIMSYLAMKDNEAEQPDKEHKDEFFDLGDVAIKYEVGVPKPGIIVNTPGDPGGKSYGPFQMSLNKGALAKYVQTSEFKVYFIGVQLGSNDFDKVWLDLSAKYTSSFMQDQREFIRKRYYEPVRRYASQQGLSVAMRSIQEALFSISVQHSGFKAIIRRAKVQLSADRRTVAQIHALYLARAQYVEGLTSLPDYIKSSIYKRYKAEEIDILRVYDIYDS